MSLYDWIKLLHILSSTLIFGTALGTAYFMLSSYRSEDAKAIRFTTSHARFADAMFTTPAAVVQFLTGMWLTWKLDIAFDSAWFLIVMVLFSAVGWGWLTVVAVEARILKIAEKGGGMADYRRPLQAWYWLGILTFAGTVILFYLMVSKDGSGLTFFTSRGA